MRPCDEGFKRRGPQCDRDAGDWWRMQAHRNDLKDWVWVEEILRAPTLPGQAVIQEGVGTDV